MQETVGCPPSPVRIMGQEIVAESQLSTGAKAALLWDGKTGEQHQMDLGKDAVYWAATGVMVGEEP